MLGLRSQFMTGLLVLSGLVLLSLVLGVVTARRARRSGAPALPRVARTLAGPAVLAVLVATALPRDWPPPFSGGDLVLRLGDGGLNGIAQLWSAPTDLAAVLLWANVALYVPVGAAIAVGWGSRRLALTCAGALSLLVESVQYLALERVASLDDLLLNLTGAAVGVLVATLLVHRRDTATSPA